MKNTPKRAAMNAPGDANRRGRGAAIDSSVVLFLTVAHHSYGVVRFATPWRHHVSLIALPTALAFWIAFFIYARQCDSRAGRIARGGFMGIALVGPIAWIGIFEGGYNHALKLILFQSNLSAAVVIRRLYPPAIYEAPGDWFFEATGVMQFAATLWALGSILRFQRLSRTSNSD